QICLLFFFSQVLLINKRLKYGKRYTMTAISEQELAGFSADFNSNEKIKLHPVLYVAVAYTKHHSMIAFLNA
ncbi:hypothetical protein AAULH_05571, partial [Lactobacillus helveticus MTCC 5463]